MNVTCDTSRRLWNLHVMISSYKQPRKHGFRIINEVACIRGDAGPQADLRAIVNRLYEWRKTNCQGPLERVDDSTRWRRRVDQGLLMVEWTDSFNDFESSFCFSLFVASDTRLQKRKCEVEAKQWKYTKTICPLWQVKVMTDHVIDYN